MAGDEKWKKFEADGPEKVRQKLARGLYNQRRERSAREWLKYHAADLDEEVVALEAASYDERRWYQKPFGIIVLGLIVVVVGAYLIGALGLN